MSGSGISAAPFAIRTVAIAVAVATIGFVSFLVLSAYAPDFKPTRNGGAHALSTSAVGFWGVAEMVRMTRGEVGMIRGEADLDDIRLLVLTPGAGTSPEAVAAILERRQGLPTLIVLPKWFVRPLPNNSAWVRTEGVIPPSFVLSPLAGTVKAPKLSRGSATELRTIQGDDLEPVLEAPGGGMLIARIGTSETYILADPDLIDNYAMATLPGAERAMAALARLVPADEGIAFDLTLPGFGRDPNLLKLAFEPPFLPLTLCLFFATLMAGWHAMRRFGPPVREDRAIAFGKRGIAENGAALLRLARRRHRTGGRYAMLTRDAAAAATGAPPGLKGEALDRYLDRLNPGGESFTSIAGRADAAPDTRGLLAAARDLYQWRRTVTRER